MNSTVIPTDKECMEWLIQHVTYFEHDQPRPLPGGYWPQTEDNLPGSADPDLVGLTLRDYIGQMIRDERNAKMKAAA